MRLNAARCAGDGFREPWRRHSPRGRRQRRGASVREAIATQSRLDRNSIANQSTHEENSSALAPTSKEGYSYKLVALENHGVGSGSCRWVRGKEPSIAPIDWVCINHEVGSGTCRWLGGRAVDRSHSLSIIMVQGDGATDVARLFREAPRAPRLASPSSHSLISGRRPGRTTGPAVRTSPARATCRRAGEP